MRIDYDLLIGQTIGHELTDVVGKTRTYKKCVWLRGELYLLGWKFNGGSKYHGLIIFIVCCKFTKNVQNATKDLGKS